MTGAERTEKPKRTQSRSGGRKKGGASPMSSVVVLTENFSLGALFARGALLSSYLESGLEPQGSSKLAHAGFGGAISHEAVEALVSSARNVIPVALVLKKGAAVRKRTHGGWEYEVVMLGDVQEIAFRDPREKARFDALEFSNYDVADSPAPLLVNEAVFSRSSVAVVGGGEADSPALGLGLPTPASSTQDPVPQGEPGNGAPVTGEAIDSIRLVVRDAECRAGLLAWFLGGGTGLHDWVKGVERLVLARATKPGGSWPERIMNCLVGCELNDGSEDSVELGIVLALLRDYPIEKGWPAEEVLERLRGVRAVNAESKGSANEFDQWVARARDVLASRREAPFGDEQLLVRRAIVLLLLRGDLDGLKPDNIDPSSMTKVGQQVRAIAGALAAYRTGLRALPASFKCSSAGTSRGLWISWLAQVFFEWLEPVDAPMRIAAFSHVQVKYVSAQPLRGTWSVEVRGEAVRSFQREMPRALARVCSLGEHLGFVLREGEGQTLVISATSGERPAIDVVLQIMRPSVRREEVLRFIARTGDEAPFGSRSKRSAKGMEDLLRLNAASGLSCRYALDGEQLVVIAEQLLATLDDAEFREHVRNVAEAAGAYPFEGKRTVQTPGA